MVALVVVIAIIAAAASGGSKSSSSSGGTSASSAKIGTPVRDGLFEFTVTKMECGRSPGRRRHVGKSAQGQYCEATLTVANIGSSPQLFDGGSQKAKGADGQTYADDTAAELFANSQDQTFLNEINPGNQVTGVLVFDVPKDAKITQLELHDSPFSGGVDVTL